MNRCLPKTNGKNVGLWLVLKPNKPKTFADSEHVSDRRLRLNIPVNRHSEMKLYHIWMRFGATASANANGYVY